MTQELGNNYYKSGWQPSIEFDETTKLFSTPAKKQTEDYITGRYG